MTSPKSGDTIRDPPIPTELQMDLDSPVRVFGPRATARRSRPFREGRGRIAPRRSFLPVSPSERCVLTEMQSSRKSVELNSSDEDETHNTVFTDSSREEPATVPVAEISLTAFNLGPAIKVGEKFMEPVFRPNKIKDLRIWTVHSSHHEHIPAHAGQHGILYASRGDIPKYLVRSCLAHVLTHLRISTISVS